MTGIDVRHRKTCPGARADGKCCTPTYQAHVWDAHTGRRSRKTFDNKTAAKQWRTDAMAAVRHGDLPTGNTRTVRRALDDLAAGMRDGTVLDRSGRQYGPATMRSYQHAADSTSPASGT